MNMDWFRSWHGAPTDPKWLLIAKRSETVAGVVSAIVWALFDHASQNSTDRGNVEAFDAETYAAFSGFEEATVQRVIDVLKEKKLIVDGHLTNWKKRQTTQGKVSTPRVQKHRNAMKRNETPRNDREDKTRSEKKEAAADEPARDVENPERGKSLICEEAFVVSRLVLIEMGLDPAHQLSCGAPWTIQGWFNAGLHRDHILTGVRRVMERRPRGPPSTLKYFEKAILCAKADLLPSLPTLEASDVQPGSEQPSLRLFHSVPGKGGGYARIVGKLQAGQSSG